METKINYIIRLLQIVPDMTAQELMTVFDIDAETAEKCLHAESEGDAAIIK